MKGWQRTQLQDLFESSVDFLDNLGDKQPWNIREFLSEIPAVLNEVLEYKERYCQLTIKIRNVERLCLGKLDDIGECTVRSFHGWKNTSV